MKENNGQTKKNKASAAACIAIGVISAFFIVAFIFSPKLEFSEEENRLLAKPPVFSVENVFNGKFTSAVEKYFTDHFPLRTAFLTVKAVSEKVLLKTETNDVLLAKNNSLISAVRSFPESQRANIVFVINKFAKENADADIYFMIAPNSADINISLLPACYSGLDGSTFTSEIYSDIYGTKNIDVYDALKKANETEPTYYRLDHHWTTYGAFAAFKAYCEKAGLAIPLQQDYTREVITTDFTGTMASAAGIFYYPPDSIERWNNERINSLTVTYYENSATPIKTTDTLYEETYLTKKDKYSYFLNANQPLCIIENKDALYEESIIVVKDSYANCFVPFLSGYYSNVYVVDLRYYAESVSALMEEANTKNVLILYNLSNLATDAGIFKLK